MGRRYVATPHGARGSGVVDACVALDVVLDLVSPQTNISDALRRIVRTACALVGASHGTLVTAGPQGQVSKVVQVDLEADGLERTDGVPGGEVYPGKLHVPLGATPGPDEGLAGDPAGGTTPALRIPIACRRGFSGVICLTAKHDGTEFTDEDEALLVAFVAVAAAVIDNAQIYDEARRRELWVALHGEIATALLAGVDFDKVLDVVAGGARELTEADLSTVLLVDTSGSLTLRAAHGHRAEQLLGTVIRIEATISGQVLANGEPVILADASSDERRGEPLVALDIIGPALFVPLMAQGRATGVLAVGRRQGRPPFGQTDFWLLRSFASQVSIALECSRARTELERLAVLDDQERIARDLHDTVIQQLVATGMSLEGTARRITDPVVGERIRQTVDTLDFVIRDIRAAVFSLGAPSRSSNGLRATVLSLVSELSDPYGLRVHVRFDGPIDTAIGPDEQPHVIATLREALSNVGRHARATRVDVDLEVGSEILLRVVDDGVGIPDDGTRKGGLFNLRARAHALGGSFDLRTPPTGGTILEWRAQLRHPATEAG